MAETSAQAIFRIQTELQALYRRRASGVTRMDENGRSMSFSQPVIETNIQRLEAELGRLQAAPPMTRRLLTYTSTKGY